MRIQNTLLSFTCWAILSVPAYCLDISGINNTANYQQSSHTQTYTVGQDGQSLFYRGKDTGMKLQTPAQAGSSIRVTDNNIPARAPTGAAAASAASGSTNSGTGQSAPSGGNTGNSSGTGGGNTGGGNTGAGNTGGGNTGGGNTGGRMANIKSGAAKVAKVGGAVLGTVGGAAMIYEGTAGQEEHSGWDVASGVGGGAIMGASIGSVVPVIGTGIGAAGGAVIGGVISGSQLFSETDCLTDPVTGLFTCCHTQFNKGQRYADIGDYMFCGVEQNGQLVAMAPGVRQCLQGGSAEKASWWDGLWKDDFWEPECKPRYCGDDTAAPQSGIENYITYSEDTVNFCWNWDCVSGYRKSGNTCVSVQNNTPVQPDANGGSAGGISSDPYERAIKKIQAERQRIINMCGATMGAGTTLM